MSNTSFFLDSEIASPAAPQGGSRQARGMPTGELFTANWKQALLLEGRLWQVTVGSLSAGGDVSRITGGGAGTTIDQDQPEFGVSVGATDVLIPVRIDVACKADLDADAEEANIVVTFDKAAAYAGDGTVTTETPVNMSTGSGASASGITAFSAATADITDPTVSGILAAKTISASDFVSNGTPTNLTNGVRIDLNLVYEPDVPIFLYGDSGAAFYGYWGGTAAVTGLASVIFGVLPRSRFGL